MKTTAKHPSHGSKKTTSDINQQVSGASSGKKNRANRVPPGSSMPEGRWGWVIVASVFCISVVIQRGLAVFFVEWKEYFNASATKVSWAVSIPAAVTGIFSPVGGALCQRFGSRKIVFLGTALNFLGYLLSCFSRSVTHLYITIGIVASCGTALQFSPALVMLGHYFKRRYVLANSIALSGFSVSQMLIPRLAQYLIEAYGWRGAILILTALGAHGFPCALLLRSPRKPKPTRQSVTKVISTKETTLNKRDDNKGCSTEGSEETIEMSGRPNTRPGGTQVGEPTGSVSGSMEPQGESSESVARKTELTSEQVMETTLAPPEGPTTQPGGTPELMLTRTGGPATDPERTPETSSTVLPTDSALPTRSMCTSTTSLHLFDVPAKENGHISENDHKVGNSSGTGDPSTPCSKVSNSTLVSLFKSSSFLTLLSGCMCGGVGFFVTMAHLVARAVHAGVSRNDAAVLMIGLGIGGLVGRAGHGILIDRHFVERDIVFVGSYIISAIVNFLNPFLNTFSTLCVFAVVLGVSQGTVSSLMFAMIRLQVTPEQAPLALAFGTFVFAVSGMAGGVLAGLLFDKTGNYDISFCFAGAMITIGSILILINILLTRRRAAHGRNHQKRR